MLIDQGPFTKRALIVERLRLSKLNGAVLRLVDDGSTGQRGIEGGVTIS
jgi:hypothetical protein